MAYREKTVNIGAQSARIQMADLNAFKPLQSRIFFGAHLNAVKDLQTSIEKLGLLSPLIVVERNDTFYVIDGKKRLAAMKRLRFAGRLPRNLNRVPYILYSEAEGRQSTVPPLLSNRELYERVVEAFRKGIEIEEIAKTLYLPRPNILKILTLSRLSDRLRQYFFDGHLNFEQAQAYAALPNRNRQDNVFEQAGPFASAEDILKTAKEMPQTVPANRDIIPLRRAA